MQWLKNYPWLELIQLWHSVAQGCQDRYIVISQDAILTITAVNFYKTWTEI